MVIAFACGVLFGVALCGVFALVFVKYASAPKLIPVQEAVEDTYASRIATQWQNMAVYDGTEKGQQEIDR